MAYLIFGGDLLVMAFMVALVTWLLARPSTERLDAAARIPLEDELDE
jgi:hypothetical protein